MELLNPYHKVGRAFKGNLHTHVKNPVTTCGDWPAEDAIRIYEELGYDFVAITNHDVFTDARGLSENSFLVIGGQEVHLESAFDGLDYHVLALGINRTIPRGDSPQVLVDEIRSAGGVPMLCHPRWSSIPAPALRPIENVSLLEIYNHSGAARQVTHSIEEWDVLLGFSRRPFWGTAVDDTHHYPEDAANGWVMVFAEELTEKSLLEAISSGAFYSTQGPRFEEISISEQGLLKVRFADGYDIRFIGAGGAVLGDTVGGMHLAARHQITGQEGYIRIEVSDREGRTAWTNPIFIKP